MEQDEPNKLAASLGTAFLAAAAEAYMPNSAVAVAPSFVLIDAWIQGMVGKVAERQRRSVVSVISAATVESSLDPLALMNAIHNDERLLLAFGEVMAAAQKTEWEEKIQALGRVLGKMAKDPAQIDPQLVWLEILKQVDRPHLRVLQTAVEVQRWHHQSGSDPREIIRSMSGLGAVARPLVSTLASLGLMEGETAPGELAQEFYELLSVEMPSHTPPRVEPNDPPIAIRQSDEHSMNFSIRVIRPEEFEPTMLWLTAVYSAPGSYTSADIVIDTDEIVVQVDLQKMFEPYLEDGAMIENFVVVWFIDGTRFEYWWKAEPRIATPHW